MEIKTYFDSNDSFIRINEALANEQGKLNLVFVEITQRGFSRSDFNGLDLALTLNPSDAPLIITSFMPEDSFLEDNKISSKFQALMAKKRVGYLRGPFDAAGLLAKYKELLSDKKPEDLLAIEINRINEFQKEMALIKNFISWYVYQDSDEARGRINKALIDGRKIGLLGTDNEVIEQIINYTYQPVPNSFMVGRSFSGIFCDVEGSLLIDNKVNIQLLITLRQLSKWKQITLWTDGDLEEIKKVLLANHITWKLVSKYLFAGAEVETAIDDDEYEVFQAKYGIKAKDYCKL